MATIRKRQPVAEAETRLAQAERLRIGRRIKMERMLEALLAPARIGIYSKTVMVEPTRTHGIIGFHVLSALVDGWPADNRRPEPHRYARSKATDVCEICGCAEGEPWHSGK